MADILYPYPKDFLLAAKILVAKLRGDETVPLVEALHAAWHIQGYALSQFDPHLFGKTTVLPLMDADRAGCLEDILSPLADTKQIPWDFIISVIMEIVRRLLTNEVNQ